MVLNLSAGYPLQTGRRFLPISFWVELRQKLSKQEVVALAQPGDEDRLREYHQESRALGLDGTVAKTRPGLWDLAGWLGRQGTLISPETGICHMARMLGLPTVVLTPRPLVPFWYRPSQNLKVIAFQKVISEIDSGQVLTAFLRLGKEVAA